MLRTLSARRRRARQRGMTLLEIMIVIAILGLLASVIVVAVVNSLDNAKIKTARLKLNELEKALQLYSVQVEEFPSQNEGLRALLTPPDGSKPFLKEKSVPKDPWQNEYLYFNPARGGNAPFEIMSKGPDGQEGTEDDIKSGGEIGIVIRRSPRLMRGLTLLEVLIVLAVLILMTGIGISTFGALKGTQLRTQTNRVAAAIRHTFNRSVATGLYMRMVIDIEADSYWVEASEVPQFLLTEKRKEGDSADGKSLKEQEKEAEKAERKRDDDAPPPAPRERFQEDGVIQRVTMERGIGIYGVYTSGQDDVFRGGKAYIHFFPHGFVEPSMIYTTDGEEAFFTLIVQPLTGKVSRKPGRVEPDRDFGKPDSEEEEGR